MRTPLATGLALALALPALAGAQPPAPRSSIAKSAPVAVAIARTPATPAAPPSVRPQPGRWVATISNGAQGDAVRFTVSPDGAELRDVQFVGSWKCGDPNAMGTLEQVQGGPPKAVPVSAGAFQSVQTRVSWWWETHGRFTSATTAEGSYRQAAKNAGCETRRLHWTARRIGD
jgi:hypothetical protein